MNRLCALFVSATLALSTSVALASYGGDIDEVRLAWQQRNSDAQVAVDGIRQQLVLGLSGEEKAEAEILLYRLELAYHLNNIPESEGIGLMEQSIEQAASYDACLALRGSYMLAQYLNDFNHSDAALVSAVINRGIEFVEGCNDPSKRARIYLRAATFYRAQQDQLNQGHALELALAYAEAGSIVHRFARFMEIELQLDLGDAANAVPQFEALLDETATSSSAELGLKFDLLGNLAEANLSLEQPEQALEYAQRALEHVLTNNLETQEQGVAQTLLAWVLLESGDVDGALNALSQGSLQQLEGPNVKPRRRHLHWYVTAAIDLALGHTDSATQSLQEMQATPGLEPMFYWMSAELLSEAAIAKGNIEKALKYQWKAVQQSEVARLATPLHFASFAYRTQRSGLYRNWLQTLSRCQQDPQCGNGTPKHWAQSPERNFAAGRVNSDLLLVATDLVAEYSQAAQLPDNLNNLEDWVQQFTVTNLSDNQPLWAAELKLNSGEELRHNLPKGVPVIYMQPLQDHILILKVTRNETEVFRYEVDSATVNEESIALYTALETRSGQPDAHLETLGGWLIEPIELALQQEAERQGVGDELPVGFVLQGALSKVPVSALRSNGRYFVEGFAAFELPSLRGLPQLPNMHAKGLDLKALGVGWPHAPEGRSAPALKYAEVELQAIVDSGIETTVLTGHQSNQYSLNRLLPGHNLLHISAHAEGPEGMASASAPYRKASMELADGSWSEEDLAALPLSNQYLVVLNGCQTGQGLGFEFDSTFGALYRSVLRAGAAAAVATRWYVDDQASLFLSEAFYRALPTKGRAVALALAQRELLASKGFSSLLTRKLEAIGQCISVTEDDSCVTADELYSLAMPVSNPSIWAAWSLMGRWD